MIYQNCEDIRLEFIRKYKNKEFVLDKTGVKTVEILFANFLVDRDWIIRKPNYDYFEQELKWYNSQSLNIYDIYGSVKMPPKAWVCAADKYGNINSNYGHLIYSQKYFNQFEKCAEELKKNPDSRRAVMIYTRPSIWVEYNEAGKSDFLCFRKDTLVLSPEGDKPIQDVIKEIEKNGRYPVYSVNFETGKREIKWANYGKYMGKKKILRVHFNNGKFIDTTENHIFYIKEKHKKYITVHAKNLCKGMRLIPSLIYKGGNGLRYKTTLTGEYSYKNSSQVHREYYKFINPNETIDGYDIHHIDENPKNNTISNLRKLTRSEHMMLHQQGKNNSIFKVKDRKDQLSKMVISLEETCSNRDFSWYEKSAGVNIETCISDFCGFAEKREKHKYSLRAYARYCRDNNKRNFYTLLSRYIRENNISPKSIVEQNCKIDRIEFLDDICDVYDIQVEDNSNFFVGWKDEKTDICNGILVHNCTFANQFFIRDGKLISIYSMRSNDAVFGWCNDSLWAKYVQAELSLRLDVPIGNLYWNAGSIHVYSRHFKFLEE